MKMAIQADKKYINSVFYILNEIKKPLLFNPSHKQIVEYRFYFTPRPPEVGFTEEKQLIQLFKNKKIIVQVDEPDEVEIGKPGSKNYQVYLLYRFKVSDKFNDFYDHYHRIQSVTENYCWFNNDTFSLTLHDDSVKSISFDTERGTRQMLTLFQTIIEHWKKNGDKPITGGEIVKAMAKFGSKIDQIQLKNIISNVRNKKIKPAGLENKIQINYSRKTCGWTVNINR